MGGARRSISERSSAELFETAIEPELARQLALDLAAGGLRQGAGPDQRDVARGEFVVVGDGLPNPAPDRFGVDRVARGALDFLDDDEHFFAGLVRHRERRAAVFAQSSIERLHRALHVLRIMVDATDDDEVLDPSRDEQFACDVDEAEVAGAQPRSVFAGNLRIEPLARRLVVAPIGAGNIGPTHPYLTDAVRGQPRAV